MILYTTEQLATINAAVAHLVKVYGEEKVVPPGALDKYAKALGPRQNITVGERDGMRVVSIQYGALMIECGPIPTATQPRSPQGQTGTVVEFEEPVRMVA